MRKIVFVLLFLVGCGKSNLYIPPGYPEITETWLVKEGHDTASYSAAFCHFDGYDIAEVKYTKAPSDSKKYGYFAGDINCSYDSVGPELYSRKYIQLIEKK